MVSRSNYRSRTGRSKSVSNLTPTEYEECVVLVEYLETMQNLGRIRLFTHIPNETFTKSWNIKRKNKAQGVRKGFPDYVVITNKEMLFIEMKRKQGSVTSPEQQEWINALLRLGFRARICYGYDEAKLFIEGKLQ